MSGAIIKPERLEWVGKKTHFQHYRWGQDAAEIAWTSARHFLVLTEAGGTAYTSVRFNGERAFEGRDRNGALTFVPAGTHREGIYEKANLLLSSLTIDPALIECSELENRVLLRHAFANRNDAVIRSLVGALRADIDAGNDPEELYVEQLAILILLRLTGRDTEPSGSSGAQLSRRNLIRLEEYVDANIGEAISLTQLAAVVDLPADTFARRFKLTTGQAPYAFVLERRISHAEMLLHRKDLEIGMISAALGFSSQSHFATTFRRFRGMSPSNWRANFLPDL